VTNLDRVLSTGWHRIYDIMLYMLFYVLLCIYETSA